MTADLDVSDLDVAAAPRTRRSIIAGAIGGILAVVGVFAKPSAVRAGVDGDVVLDATNAGVGTTEINATSSDPAFRVLGGNVGIRAVGAVGVDAAGPVAVRGTSTDPAGVGVSGSALLDATSIGALGQAAAGDGVRGVATSGLAVRGTSSAGHGIRGRGALDGTIGESTAGRSGVVGFSGSGGAAPAGPAKTGVYGEATQDATSRGVSGFTLTGQGVRGEATTGQGVQGQATTGIGVRGNATTGIGVQGITDSDPASRGVFGLTTNGQGVRGEASTSGIGVRAVSATGNALDVSGKFKFSRSGIANVPANKDLVDVTVPGGIAATAMVFAVMQYKRTGVWVIAARPAWPSAGLLRIYLNKVGSTTATTPVAWFVLS